MNYNRYMHKRAWFPVISDTITAVGALGSTAATYLIAGAALTGGALGWGASQLTAKTPTDDDTVKKVYTRERTKADIGYLKAKLYQEYMDRFGQDGDKPKSMRLL